MRLVEDGEIARTFDVELAATAPPSGAVTVVDGARAEGTRSVEADTCGEVAEELSLIVALALDPHAQRSSPPSMAPPAVDPAAGGSPSKMPLPLETDDAGTTPSTPPAGLGDAGMAPPSTVPTAPPVPLAVMASPPPPPVSAPGVEQANARAVANALEARPDPLGLHFFGGVDLALATDVAPEPLVGGAPYVGWRSTGARLIGLSVRAAFLRIGTGALEAGGGTADFTWTVGRVDTCGLLRADRALRFGGCARVEAGVLEGVGGEIVGHESQFSPWVAGGTLGRVEWTFLGSLLLEVEAGPTFRLNADRFIFQPNTTVYEVPFVGLDAEAGLGVHFL